MNTVKCPGCGEPVSGPTCRDCEINVHIAQTVTCYFCKETALESECQTETVRKDVGRKQIQICPNCQDV